MPSAVPPHVRSHTGFRALARAVVVSVLAAVALLALCVPAAWAHDVLISTDPADGSTVGSSPSAVTLTFDQPAIALGSQVRVTAPSGELVSSGKPDLVNTTVTEHLAGTLPPGRYTVAWRVTSADGHPISGDFSYRATAAGTGSAGLPAPATASSSRAPAGSALMWTVAAVVVVAGGVTALHRRRSRSTAQAAAEEQR